jgi:hypothetical protein
MNSGRVVCHASTSPFGLGLLEEREQPPHFAQALAPRRRLSAHRSRDALRRAEQVAEHGDRRT